SITAEEWTAFAEAHGQLLGYPDGLPVYRLFHETGRPDVLKRLRLQLRAFPQGADGRPRTPGLLADLHSYVLVNFQIGVEYAIRLAHRLGYTRDEVMDVFAVATFHTCSRGLSDTCLNPTAMEEVSDWPAEGGGDRVAHPDGWVREPEALSSGLDFTTL